jgi:hypothetical protein
VPPFRRTSGSEPPKLGGSVRLRAGAPGRCREDYTLDRVFTPLAALFVDLSLVSLSLSLCVFGSIRRMPRRLQGLRTPRRDANELRLARGRSGAGKVSPHPLVAVSFARDLPR